MKNSLLSLVALSVLHLGSAHAEGETPPVSGHGTQTYVQLAQGSTPAQGGSATSPTDKLPAPPPPRATKEQICGSVYQSYRRVILSNPEIANSKNSAYNGLIGISATVARHATLERLLTMSWSQQCDMVPFLALEDRVIQANYLSPEIR